MFECLFHQSIRGRLELVPSRDYGVKWMTSSKAENQF
jgi:hypothetical protein